MTTGRDGPWETEERSMCEGLTDDVFEIADCVELPADLCIHAEAADLDPAHDAAFDEWCAYLSERNLFLPVEQSCDADGLLLGWDMRGIRLGTPPPLLLGQLHFFFEKCPRHTRALLVHWVFWLVRFERINRRGTPAWTIADTVIEEDEESAFFQPNRLTIRHQAR